MENINETLNGIYIIKEILDNAVLFNDFKKEDMQEIEECCQNIITFLCQQRDEDALYYSEQAEHTLICMRDLQKGNKTRTELDYIAREELRKWTRINNHLYLVVLILKAHISYA